MEIAGPGGGLKIVSIRRRRRPPSGPRADDAHERQQAARASIDCIDWIQGWIELTGFALLGDRQGRAGAAEVQLAHAARSAVLGSHRSDGPVSNSVIIKNPLVLAMRAVLLVLVTCRVYLMCFICISIL